LLAILLARILLGRALEAEGSEPFDTERNLTADRRLPTCVLQVTDPRLIPF
jgi:hypothetical protein